MHSNQFRIFQIPSSIYQASCICIMTDNLLKKKEIIIGILSFMPNYISIYISTSRE